jgi:hypothetical protein
LIKQPEPKTTRARSSPDAYCLPSIVFEQAVVGASLDAYHCSYPPVLLLTTPLARVAHVPAPLAWLAAGWYAFYRALRLAMPGPRRAAARAGRAGGFHQRGRRTEQHRDGAVRRGLEPASSDGSCSPADCSDC